MSFGTDPNPNDNTIDKIEHYKATIYGSSPLRELILGFWTDTIPYDHTIDKIGHYKATFYGSSNLRGLTLGFGD